VQGNSRGPSIGLIPDAKAYDDAADNGGVPVEGARKDSPAEKAGLRQGDLIVEVAGKPVKNITAYMGEMNKAKRGEPLEITVSRDGKKVILKVELPK
jgi:S1-C subfamily serine protease